MKPRDTYCPTDGDVFAHAPRWLYPTIIAGIIAAIGLTVFVLATFSFATIAIPTTLAMVVAVTVAACNS